MKDGDFEQLLRK